jgi:hydroxymethylbilane synthase
MLAMWQSTHIRAVLSERFPDVEFELKKIVTTGDKILDSPLAKIGDKGLFTKQIEMALLAGEIDLAVHSLKDVPTAVEAGLAITAITKREDPRDVIVSKNGVRLEDMPKGARIATSSLRRKSQLLNYRPDLVLEDIRGNVDTRLNKLDETPGLQATLLARAGLVRLKRDDRITQVLDTDIMLPAVGQGALGIETRANDDLVVPMVKTLNDPDAAIAVTAERALLAHLEGGCQVPIGALGTVENGKLRLDAMVASLDGTQLFRDFLEGDVADAKAIGIALAKKLVDQGAGKVLDEINRLMRSE